MFPAAALVIIVPLQLARGHQDQCQWWRGGCQLAGAGDTVLHQEAGPTLQQCMSLCRAVAGCGYIAWSQHLLGDTTCRLLRLALALALALALGALVSTSYSTSQLSSAPASPCLSAGRRMARACAWVARCAATRAPRSSWTRTGWGSPCGWTAGSGSGGG